MRHHTLPALLGLLLLAPAAAATTLPAPAPMPSSRLDALHVGALWGQMAGSQLAQPDPISFWSIRADLPLSRRHGLWMQLRFDSAVYGDPGTATSMLVHPGRTDYSLAVGWQQPGSPLGLEYHHVSSHEVASLHGGTDGNDFRDEFDIGGASNFGSLYLDTPVGLMRAGVGSVWVDTNTAPILLGLQGVLLNSNSARGPFASMQVPVPLPLGFAGRAAGLAVVDLWERPAGSASHDYLAWAASVQRPLGPLVALGASYAGNNPRLGEGSADHLYSAYLELRWRVES